jgi:hypothetical protein
VPLVNRRVRNRTHGGVGAWGGSPPPATRFHERAFKGPSGCPFASAERLAPGHPSRARSGLAASNSIGSAREQVGAGKQRLWFWFERAEARGHPDPAACGSRAPSPQTTLVP